MCAVVTYSAWPRGRPEMLGRMHLDISTIPGIQKTGVTLTALIIHEEQWSSVLSPWLAGRRAIHAAFGVSKKQELHANHLYKGRKKYCDTQEQGDRYGLPLRNATGRIMLTALAKNSGFTVVAISNGSDGGSSAIAAIRTIRCR